MPVIEARQAPSGTRLVLGRAKLASLFLDPEIGSRLHSLQAAWRQVVMKAQEHGIPVPAMSAGLAYFDAYRTEQLPQNLTQAQRDAFGAHTYQRLDKKGTFHTFWQG